MDPFGEPVSHQPPFWFPVHHPPFVFPMHHATSGNAPVPAPQAPDLNLKQAHDEPMLDAEPGPSSNLNPVPVNPPSGPAVVEPALHKSRRVHGVTCPVFNTGTLNSVPVQKTFTFWASLMSFIRLSGNVNLEVPQELSDLMACQLQGTAGEWLQTFLDQNPEPTTDDLKAAFFLRWAPEVSTHESEAYDKVDENRLK